MAYDETLAQRMRKEMEHIPGFAEKKMFGGIGFMIHCHMACGVNGNDMIVRLDPNQYEVAMRKPFVEVFDMTGRPMKGWVVVTPGGFESQEELKRWIELGVQFAHTLPQK